MKKSVLLQSPAHLYEVVPIFYKELDALNYFDKFYLVTNEQNPSGLGENVVVIQLEQDLGRANNFLRALDEVEEDIFVMMCDDHIIKQSRLNLDQQYQIMLSHENLGRLQLSPPSSNYLKYMYRKNGADWVPNYNQSFGIYPRNYRWHVNFQPSLWRKDFFRYCVRGGENRNKLELRAAARGRHHPKYHSGFIYEWAVQVDNFYASCKVYNADPTYNRMKNSPHYREEFIRYAIKHRIVLRSERNVYVKRANFVASVPQSYYLKNMDSDEALGNWAVSSSPLRSFYARFSDRLKVGLGPTL